MTQAAATLIHALEMSHDITRHHRSTTHQHHDLNHSNGSCSFGLGLALLARDLPVDSEKSGNGEKNKGSESGREPSSSQRLLLAASTIFSTCPARTAISRSARLFIKASLSDRLQSSPEDMLSCAVPSWCCSCASKNHGDTMLGALRLVGYPHVRQVSGATQSPGAPGKRNIRHTSKDDKRTMQRAFGLPFTVFILV